MNKRVRVRFAPSPTGHLHVGGARTAIFNWLFARRHEGSFIVRVEDTDQMRSTLESEQMVLGDLQWLGLQWDEGPDVGGAHAPYRQSERRVLYASVAAKLLERAHAYRCFCSEEELERKRKEAEIAGRPPHYDLTCHRLSVEESDARAADGATFAIRFHVPKEPGAAFDADVTIHDRIRGDVTWRKESLGDFILVRSDGMPTYNFSVVVDDHDMDITHVIRAEEHLTNTHRQVLLYRAMGWGVPEFAHVSLILGQDRTKLSKRHGATSVSAYAEEGYLPEAMLNYLTLLGWSSPDSREIFSRQFAAENFDLERVNAAPAVFDPQKFAWLNGEYIVTLPLAHLRPLVAQRLHSEGMIKEVTSDVEAWLDEAIELVRKGIDTLAGFAPALRFLFEYDADAVLADPDARAVLDDPDSLPVIRALADDLRSHGAPDSPEGYQALASRIKEATKQKGKKLFMPIRVALTGSTHGPELQRALPLMDRGTRIVALARVAPPLERVEELLERLGRLDR